MRFENAIIQNRNIEENTKNNFFATYKGKKIIISDNHGLGKPNEWYLTRYNAEVIDIESGLRDVDTYYDCNEIREAIILALKGAMLLS